MALSNTATPKHYGRFRDMVLSGEIPVNEEVSLEMNRIDDLIANPNVYYDSSAINGYVLFCENELCLTDGSPMSLLFTFKLWAEQALAWFYYSPVTVYVPNEDGRGGRYEQRLKKKRLINKQVIQLGRGGAKSMYAMTMHAYFLVCDKTSTNQIATGPTMIQADEVMSPLVTSISRARGPLFKFMTQGSRHTSSGQKVQLAATKKGIQFFPTNSLIQVRPMTINKLQGLRLKFGSMDEVFSGDIREDVTGALEQGASKVDDYLLLIISSEGTVRNAAGDDIKMELYSILRGDYQNPHMSIWLYKLDSIEEVKDPTKWPKAQPNLGYTVEYDTYHREVEKAEQVPSQRNDILAKRFGIPMEGYTYFFTYQETLPQLRRYYYNQPCAMGIDGSQGDDFFAFTFIFPQRDGSYGVEVRAYVSSYAYTKVTGVMRYKYDEFINEGSLQVIEGRVLDPMVVYDDLHAWLAQTNFDIRTVGYDIYGLEMFINRWKQDHGEYGVDRVIQGARTESVPLGDLKQLAEQRALIFWQSLMVFSMGNAIVLEDNNQNRKLSKKRHAAKIDNVAALLNAYVAARNNPQLLE